jgi:hypothetical protein
VLPEEGRLLAKCLDTLSASGAGKTSYLNLYLRSISSNQLEEYFMFKKSLLALALAGASMGAQAVAVSTITITGGDFAMGPASGACDPGPGGFGNFRCVTAGSNPTLTANSTSSPSSITAFNFFGAPVTTFLASSATGAANANDWTLGFTGDVTAGAMTLNLGGFYANWSGTNFLQGTDSSTNGGLTSAAATGTASGGNFDITWHSYIGTAPFNGQTGNWHLTGTYTLAPVPEASTYGMMLAGLGLVGAVAARRRRKAA